jgi:hypothetical protein
MHAMKIKITRIIFKYSVTALQTTHSVFVIKPSHVMLHREILSLFIVRVIFTVVSTELHTCNLRHHNLHSKDNSYYTLSVFHVAC